ncbi:MAG: dual specificity protein phosphatase [Chloroflexi bacterium]|nr:dual specificity protein phosphatase [Chloroflexota bacterium]
MHRRTYGASRRKHSEITPQLHVGGQHRRKGYKRLLKRGITAIVNMREEKYSDEKKGIGGERHLHLPTIDHTPPSIEDLMRGVDFIRREIEQYHGKVYIHCRAGCGRAPSMAAAYLISTGMSRKEALKFIKKARPFISLNKIQKRVLDDFAAAWADRLNQGSCQS